ncbi:hypothetical protein OAN307_c31450 [Octadecabacter antarcticus 307]|uniref:Uncharacterized protein n=1 Tax=Octadecabacter antarcticus 307 TaxID=391626 RepID=M9R7N6_9RHOB|nr:hypothetical protein [Octadecabacter antarcticus]AGI68679.1 hypothetical protein OAN307_c31450 [Octadecabacter antarcticus 307]
MSEDQNNERVLSAEFVSTLVETYKIPTDRVARFQSNLELYCARFIERRAIATQQGPLTKQRITLAKVSTNAAKFRDFIDTLPDHVRDVIGTATGDFNGEQFDIECGAFETDSMQTPPPVADKAFLNVEILRAQLTLLIQGAEYAQKIELKKPTKGPNIDKDFEDWIANMRLVWRTSTGKAFTRDDYEGAANSLAAEFCVQVCDEVAPDIAEQKVLNAMKKQITRDRQSPYWKN